MESNKDNDPLADLKTKCEEFIENKIQETRMLYQFSEWLTNLGIALLSFFILCLFQIKLRGFDFLLKSPFVLPPILFLSASVIIGYQLKFRYYIRGFRVFHRSRYADSDAVELFEELKIYFEKALGDSFTYSNLSNDIQESIQYYKDNRKSVSEDIIEILSMSNRFFKALKWQSNAFIVGSFLLFKFMILEVFEWHEIDLIVQILIFSSLTLSYRNDIVSNSVRLIALIFRKMRENMGYRDL